MEHVSKASSLVRYPLLLVTVKPQVANNICPHPPGLYSGIFAVYLQHRGSQQSTDKAQNMVIFYSLWVLYALTATTMIVDILSLHWVHAVSINVNHGCLTYQLVFTEHRDTIPPSNSRSHTIFLLRLHHPIYSSTYNRQMLIIYSSNSSKRYIVVGLFGVTAFVL